jgi:hypothetical protein
MKICQKQVEAFANGFPMAAWMIAIGVAMLRKRFAETAHE